MSLADDAPPLPDPRRLADVAALAVARGRADAALRIFTALAAARPDCRATTRGLAVALVCNGRYREAAGLFAARTPTEAPGDGLARCFYALALARGGQHDSGTAALTGFAEGDDPACRALAREQLGWSDGGATP